MAKPLRWGFLGAGKISSDFANALHSLPRSEHQLHAVAARDIEKARDFADTFGFSASYGSYKEIALDPAIDIVYISTINSNHYELSKLMLENNKHVLCEKPLTLLLEHTKELVKLAEEKKKFFQEAIWSRFFPAYKRLREEVAARTIGDIKLVTAQFGFNNPTVSRLAEKKLGRGTMGDIGVYVSQFALAVYGPELPETVKAVGILNDDGCDMSLGIVLQYKDGRIAQLTTTFLADISSEAIAYGSKGYIKLPSPFWATTEIIINGEKTAYPLPNCEKKMIYGNSQGLVYEAQEVYRCINEELLESPFLTHQETIIIATIAEEVRKEVGVSYKELYE